MSINILFVTVMQVAINILFTWPEEYETNGSTQYDYIDLVFRVRLLRWAGHIFLSNVYFFMLFQRAPYITQPCHNTDGKIAYSYSCTLFFRCDSMMTSSNGNILRVIVSLWGKSTSHRWNPLTKGNDAELWWFLWSVPEQTVEKTTETPVILDAIALIVMSPYGMMKCWRAYHCLNMFLSLIKRTGVNIQSFTTQCQGFHSYYQLQNAG